MLYVIRNQNGSYLRNDSTGRLSTTTCLKKARTFTDMVKAVNVLLHCIPESSLASWDVMTYWEAKKETASNWKEFL